jgi:hypothetical protein
MKMLIIGAAMRKLVHIIFGVLKSGSRLPPPSGLNMLDNQDGI